MRPKPLCGTRNPDNVRRIGSGSRPHSSCSHMQHTAGDCPHQTPSHVFGMLRMVWWEAAGCSVMMTSMLHVFGHIRNSDESVEKQYAGKQIRV